MQVHQFAPFNISFLPFCESKIIESFLTTNFKPIIIKKLVQNYQTDRRKNDPKN